MNNNDSQTRSSVKDLIKFYNNFDSTIVKQDNHNTPSSINRAIYPPEDSPNNLKGEIIGVGNFIDKFEPQEYKIQCLDKPGNKELSNRESLYIKIFWQLLTIYYLFSGPILLLQTKTRLRSVITWLGLLGVIKLKSFVIKVREGIHPAFVSTRNTIRYLFPRARARLMLLKTGFAQTYRACKSGLLNQSWHHYIYMLAIFVYCRILHARVKQVFISRMNNEEYLFIFLQCLCTITVEMEWGRAEKVRYCFLNCWDILMGKLDLKEVEPIWISLDLGDLINDLESMEELWKKAIMDKRINEENARNFEYEAAEEEAVELVSSWCCCGIIEFFGRIR